MIYPVPDQTKGCVSGFKRVQNEAAIAAFMLRLS
jgi:hypothetical protein